MGDNFTPPFGFAAPPSEPEYKPPDFESMGVNLVTGIENSGFWPDWFKRFIQAGIAIFAACLGAVLSWLLRIFAKVIGIVGDVTNDASAGYGVIVAATLKELFGVDVDPATVSTRRAGPDRQAVANKLGQTIIGAFFSASQSLPGGGLTPSASAADNFLAVTMNMELNGWIESWVTDGLSGHILEKFGDLKDGMARVLGLGRMSRQVFAAPLKVLVHDPYLELLNQKYRPKQWDVTSLIGRLNRGVVTRADLSTPLGNQGYTEAQIDELIYTHHKWLSLGDLDYMDQRGLSFGDFTKNQLIAQGYAPDDADLQISIMRDKRIQKYRQKMVDVGEAAYVAGNIGPDTFGTIVQLAGVTDEEAQWIQKLADLKVSVKTRHLSEGEIIKGIEEGFLNFNDLRTWATREGMSLQDEQVLELEVLYAENKASAMAKVKQQTAAAKVEAANAKLQTAQLKAQAAKAQAADKGLTAVQAATLVKDNIWNMSQFTAFLTNQGYGPDAITANIQLLQAEMNAIATKTAAAAATRSTAAAKGLNLAQIEKAVVEGITTEDKLRDFLTHEGYSADDAQIIVDLTHHELTAAQVKADATKAAHAKAATKSISLPDLERAIRLGLTTQASYDAALQKAGFDAMSIALLDGILQKQLASDKAAAAKSAAAATKTTAKGVSVAQLEQEVIAGIRPIGDYMAALNSLGYGHDDQIQLTALLQLKVDQAKSTAAKRAAAAASLETRGISLPDAERAVKLGIVPIGVYQAMLKSLHYSQDAIDVLSNTLVAQMAATRKAQSTANTVGKALAAKSISLADIEKAVLAGLHPIEKYTLALTTAGYSDVDAGTLTELLQLKVDQAAAAKAAHADAEGVATNRGISLGKEEAAVVAGDKTMNDYDALLTALGYDDVDRATLEQLLQTKVDAAAAKASKSAPAAAGPPDQSGGGSTAGP